MNRDATLLCSFPECLVVALVVVGVSHHNSPVQVREALAFARDTLPTALVRLKREAGVSEVMILSTCNRVEVYAAGGVAEAQTIASVLRAHACARSRVVPILDQRSGQDDPLTLAARKLADRTVG